MSSSGVERGVVVAEGRRRRTWPGLRLSEADYQLTQPGGPGGRTGGACCCLVLLTVFASIFLLAALLVVMSGELEVGLILLLPCVFCSLLALCLCSLMCCHRQDDHPTRQPAPSDVFTIEDAAHFGFSDVPPSYEASMREPKSGAPPSYESLVSGVSDEAAAPPLAERGAGSSQYRVSVYLAAPRPQTNSRPLAAMTIISSRQHTAEPSAHRNVSTSPEDSIENGDAEPRDTPPSSGGEEETGTGAVAQGADEQAGSDISGHGPHLTHSEPDRTEDNGGVVNAGYCDDHHEEL